MIRNTLRVIRHCKLYARGIATQGKRRKETIDLRSDTVTKPTAQMTCAMMDARVGDDVYMEDPTVNKLQVTAADILGKEDAIFMPSGTMSNLVGIALHCGRGDECIVGDEQHVVVYEQGGVSQFFGIVLRTLPQNADGTFPLSGPRSLESAIASRPAGDVHYSRPACVSLENTHNRMGGTVLPQDWVDDCAAISREHGLALHMDGARLFNAAIASGTPASRIVRDCTTVSICLSKGLGAPVGSLLVGPAPLIARARHLRKALGGGMRQAGVIAAAGLVGLADHAHVLAADHKRALALAKGISALRGVKNSLPSGGAPLIDTNIFFFELDAALVDPRHFLAAFPSGGGVAAGDAPGESLTIPAGTVAPHMDSSSAFAALVRVLGGVRVGAYGHGRLRAVVHHQVDDEDIEVFIRVAATALRLLSVQ